MTTARRVPFPLMNSVKEVLKRMVDSGTIRVITEPTDWCSPMVPVRKKNGKLKICVDLKKLNVSVKRERYMLPTLVDIAPKRSKIFQHSRYPLIARVKNLQLSSRHSEGTAFREYHSELRLLLKYSSEKWPNYYKALKELL